jgi:hypothetical protein
VRVAFNGLELGDDTLYNITSIDGLDSLPDLTIGMAPKPRRHGSWLGGKLAQKRIITLALQIMGDPADDWRTTKPKNALVNACQIMDVELPLIFDMDYGEQAVMVNASVTALELPIVSNYSQLREGIIEFTCTDPMKYTVASQQGAASPPTAPPAVEYGLDYGFQYSEAMGTTGSFTAHNTGNSPAHAVYTIDGPISRPFITLLDSSGTRTTTFGTSLSERDVLKVDTARNSVTVNGSDAYGTARGALVADLVIRPGDTVISFNGDVPSGKFPQLNVSWRDASR